MAFHYNAVSKAGGRATTRISIQGQFTEQQLVTNVATETGFPAAQVTTIGTAILRQIILGAGQESKNLLRLFELMSFRPTCGGDFPNIEFQPTADAMNLAIRGSLSPAGQTLFEAGLEFIRDDSIGEKHAIIDRVYNATTKTTDHYTAGGGFKINGQDLGQPDLASSEFGVFLEAVANGNRVKVTSIIDWTDGEITGAWPAGITGAQRLVVVTQYAFGHPRTTIYGTNLVA